MRREGIFIGKEEVREVCNGGMVKGLWWVDEECIVEVSGEDIDKGCCYVVGGEVGSKYPGRMWVILEARW